MAVIKKDIRKLYGRSPRGERNREHIRASITPDTMDHLRELVEVKNGGYGSAFVEMSLRLMIILLSPGVNSEGVDILEYHAAELQSAIDSPYFAENMEKLARLLKA